MIGVDSNVLVRLALDDGSPEVKRARAFADEIDRSGEVLFVNLVVLVETTWVLARLYGTDRPGIEAFVRALVENRAFEIQERDAVLAALGLHAGGTRDFSDCLTATLNARLADTDTVTFDRGMRRLPRVRTL